MTLPYGNRFVIYVGAAIRRPQSIQPVFLQYRIRRNMKIVADSAKCSAEYFIFGIKFLYPPELIHADIHDISHFIFRQILSKP